MSTTIDEKVVEMKFDNAQFEKNVETSMSTLGKLKQSLKLEDASRSLEGINDAAGRVNLSGISNAVETVQLKFSALEVVAATALANITNSAVNTGKQLVASLSIDQISAGWGKYANKTSSVATLISQGYDLSTVDEQLNRLNWYTDETSYNFTDMVANIAKFTATGQDLNTSVTAMEGIANWAALSGQNASTASRAMYQLAQAMSAGYMRLEDYKSIQNASMDTAEFRQKCLDAAVAVGTLQQNADGTYSSLVDGATSSAFSLSAFTTKLTEGCWLTSDVMMRVFNTYSGAVDQIYAYADEKGVTASEAIAELGDSVDSFGLKAFKAAQEARSWADVIDSVKDAVSTGWMKTFEIIFGNYEESTKLWTDLANAMYDVFAAGAEDRNDMLETWKELGGRTVLVETFWTAWENVGEVLGTVKEAFRAVFPKMTAEQLYAMTEGLKNLVDKFKMSDSVSQNLKSTFKGLFAVLDIVGQAFSAVINAVKPLLGFFPGLVDGILGVTGNFGEWLVKLDETIRQNEIFKKAIEAIISFIQGIPPKLDKVFKSITGVSLGDAFDAIRQKISDALRKIEDSFGGFECAAEAFVDFIKKIPKRLNKAFKSITGVSLGDVFDEIRQKISDALEKIKEAFDGFKNVDTSGIDSLTEKIKVRFAPLAALFDGVKKIFEALLKFLKKMIPIAEQLATLLGNALGSLGDALMDAIENADFDAILDIINGGTLVAIGAGIKRFTDGLGGITKNGSKMLKSITGILNGVKGCLTSWQHDIQAKVLKTIASAVALLTASIVALSLIDSNKLGAALTAITAEFTELFIAMKALTKIMTAKSAVVLGETAKSMVVISAAIFILSSAMKKLGGLGWDGILKGIAGIGSLSAILVVSAKNISKSTGDLTKGAVGLVAFAVAIKLLVKPVKELGELDFTNLAKGLIGVGALCVELAFFLENAQFDDIDLKAGLGILALAEAIKVLASAVKIFAELDTGGMIQGLVGIGVVIAEMMIFSDTAARATNVIATAAGITMLGAAMLIFGEAIEKMGSLSPETLAVGLLAMAAALSIVSASLNSMPKDTATIAAGMVLVGAALNIIASAMASFGEMSWEEMAKSVVMLGASLVILSSSLTQMKGSLEGSAAILVAAAAIGILTPALRALGSMSLAEIGRSLLVLAGAFTVIGVAASVLSTMAPVILALSGAIALLGVGALACGAGLLAFSAGLSALAVSGGAGITTLILAIEAILSLIPQILIKVGEGIVALIELIGNSAEAIANTIAQILYAVLKTIVDVAPQLAETVVTLIDTLLNTLAEHMPSIIQAGWDIVIALLEGLQSHISEVITTVVDVIVQTLEAIAAKIPDIIQAGIDIIISLIDGLAQGIEDNAPRIRDAFIHLFESLVEAVLVFLGIHSPSKVFADIGINVIQGLINGIGSLLGSLLSKMGEILGKMVSAIKNKMGEFLSKGKELMTNLKEGISNKISAVKDTVKNVVSGAITTIKDKVPQFLSKGKELMSNLKEGISNKLSAVKTAATDIISNVVGAMNGKNPEFASVGTNLIMGLKKGITDVAGSVVETAKGVVGSAIEGAKKLLGIKSPSRVFAEIGEYTDKGFIVGLQRYSSKVADASENVGQEAIDGVKNAISGIVDVVDSNIDAEPTIRPVMDLSDVVSGADEINKMLYSQRTMTLAANTNAAINGTLANNQNGIAVNNNDVVDAISTLRSDVTSLAGIISNLKVVMDTGTLVGTLTAPLNTALGRQAVYEGRGI